MTAAKVTDNVAAEVSRPYGWCQANNW